jgi:hypothetical protein
MFTLVGKVNMARCASLIATYNHDMASKDIKVTVTTKDMKTGDVYSQMSQVTGPARFAEPNSGQLPITYFTNRDKRVGAYVPEWVGRWLENEENAARVVADVIAARQAEEGN